MRERHYNIQSYVITKYLMRATDTVAARTVALLVIMIGWLYFHFYFYYLVKEAVLKCK